MGNYSGYAGQLLTGVPVSIANGDQESSAIPLNGMGLCLLTLPAAFTGTALTFEICETAGGTFLPLYTSANALVTIAAVAQGRTYVIDPTPFLGAAFLKIKSGTAEAAARALTVSLRG